jgi:UDP-N-acetylmuramoyl-L-alanyl-D-glutamate--2,6-diaminopimelate ligase
MEVSSHAIDQHRIGGIAFDTAVFTNLTRDHLDYHGDMATYAETKAELFRRPELRQAVLNVDDSFGLRLAGELRGRVPVVACGRRPEAVLSAERFVRASEIEARLHGLRLCFESSWGSGAFEVGLLGQFNVDNLLLVIGTALSAGIELEALIPRLAGLRTVAGRMEALRAPNAAEVDRPLVVIDYAHTPDALAKVLESLRPHVTGRLICVFGCGGDRDPGKRPQMGAIAESRADALVLTDDNPRHEDGAAIVREILSGMQTPELAEVERERATAIRRAIRNAGWGDLVLIAGKGHEDYQQFGDLKLPFSDFQHARSALGLPSANARVDSGDRGGVS